MLLRVILNRKRSLVNTVINVVSWFRRIVIRNKLHRSCIDVFHLSAATKVHTPKHKPRMLIQCSSQHNQQQQKPANRAITFQSVVMNCTWRNALRLKRHGMVWTEREREREKEKDGEWFVKFESARTTDQRLWLGRSFTLRFKNTVKGKTRIHAYTHKHHTHNTHECMQAKSANIGLSIQVCFVTSSVI